MFLLDTNVISELRKAGDGSADATVIAWLSSKDAADFYISAITVMEIERGILRGGHRNYEEETKLRIWVNRHIMPEFEGRILPIDTAVTLRCASFDLPDQYPERDAFIAATAHAHGMTVVTRDTDKYAPTGVSVLNPWEKSVPGSRSASLPKVRYGHKPPRMEMVDVNEILCLFDHVDDMVRFCSCNMTRERYGRDGNAAWAVVQRLVGNDEAANQLIAKLREYGG